MSKDTEICGGPPVSSVGAGDAAAGLVRSGALDPPSAPGEIGRAGRFVLIRQLGQGGMGVVFLARDPESGADVAVKTLRSGLASDPAVVRRFLNEARHMRRMSHPHILRVIEISEDSSRPWYAMPYVPGGSLAERIHGREPLPRDEALRVAIEVADALRYAHDRGIIHRDLKPANVLLDAEGRAVLTDFGLLNTVFNDSFVEADGSRPHGTAPYFSPGLAAGRAEDTRCDIYAFGATLYEMLAGRPPYAGATVDAILAQIRRGPPPPILEVHPEAPPELAAVADGAMARELRDRYASMEDVLADLRRIEAGRSAHGPRHRARSARAGFDGSGWRAAPWLIAAVAAAILAALVGIVAWHLLGGPPSRPALDRLRRPPAGAPPVVPAPWRARP